VFCLKDSDKKLKTVNSTEKKMIIYYQNEFNGKEIADSLGRYFKYCLDEKTVRLKELSIDITEVIQDLNDKYLILFTSLEQHDTTYWITLMDTIVRNVNNQGCMLKILNLTMREDFPFTGHIENIVPCLNIEHSDWLEEIGMWSYKALEIDLTDIFKKQFCSDFKIKIHRSEKGKGDYKNKLEKFINQFGWNENLKESLMKTCLKRES